MITILDKVTRNKGNDISSQVKNAAINGVVNLMTQKINAIRTSENAIVSIIGSGLDDMKVSSEASDELNEIIINACKS